MAKDIIAAMPSYLRNRGKARSYSFPPCADATSEADLPDIDEEPFAHFLTPIMDDDDPHDPLSLSAGIVVVNGARTSKATKFKSNIADKWARYVKSHHTQLHTRYHHDSNDEESFMQLEDDRLNDIPQLITQLTEPTRGRAQELVSRKARSRRRNARTLSGHRHSWREPSPGLFTVDESEEDEPPMGMLRRTKTKKAKDGVERRRSSKSIVREVAEKSRL